MEKNKKYYKLFESVSVEDLKKMIRQKKTDIKITKLKITKADLIIKELDTRG